MADPLTLSGAKWVNQLVPVGRAYPPSSDWPYVLLPDQVDQIRDAINDHSAKMVERDPFESIFTVATSTWVVAHGFPYRPQVSVFDSAGRMMLAQVEHTSATSVTVSHNAPLTGTLRLY